MDAQLAATDKSSAAAIALQKQIFDQQRADNAPFRDAQLRGLQNGETLAGNNRQIIMGPDGKFTAGPQNRTLGGYANPSSSMTTAAPVAPTGTPIGAFGGNSDGSMGKPNTDAMDPGMTNPGDMSTQLANGAQWITVMNGMGQTRRVPSDQIPAGWAVLNGGVGLGGGASLGTVMGAK